MFANPTKVGISQRVVATLVACATVLWSFGAYAITQAADLTDISATISDSDPGATASTTIQFTVPTGSSIATGNNITVTYDAQDDGVGGQDYAGGNIGAVISDNSDLLAATNTGPYFAPTFVSSNANSFTINGLAAAAGQIVEIQVAAGVVSNPTTVDSYEFLVEVANGTSDSGRTRVAIVNNVLVTAIVETVFDFTITGTATSTATNGTSTTGSTSDVAINFGTIVASGVYNMAQTLNVSTNAANGFVVTVESDGDLASANGAVIDNFDEGSDVADTGTPWNSPVPVVTDDTSWGHWGMRSDDGDLNALGGYYSGEFGATDFIAASTTPRQVFHHDGPSDGTSANLGEVDVLYRLEITGLQEAADDYNTILTYIATPTF